MEDVKGLGNVDTVGSVYPDREIYGDFMSTFPVAFDTPDWSTPVFEDNGMGPYVNGGDTYLFAKGDGVVGSISTMGVLKATDASDPTNWAAVVTSAFPQGEFSGPQTISTVQVGVKIHTLFLQDAAGGQMGIYYSRFDMSLDEWDEIDTTQIEVLITQILETPDNSSLVVRSNGDIVVTFSGEEEKVHGTNFDRIHFSVSSDGGQTWSAPVSLQQGAEINRRGGLIVHNDQTDDSHLLVHEAGTLFQITLNSSNVLQTYTDTGVNINDILNEKPASAGLVVERGTESHARVIMGIAGSPIDKPSILEFDSVPDPVGYSVTEIDNVSMEAISSKFEAALGVFLNGQLIAVWSRINPVTGDDELFWSTDNGDTGAGDTWEAARLLVVSDFDHVSGRIIDRGDGNGEKFAIAWGGTNPSQLTFYMEIEPNDFSPNTLDELGQPIEGYNLSPVIV